MGYVIGVDLGTTYTAAAVQRDGTAQISSLGSRGAAIPSVVLLRDDETVLTGEAAERRSMTEPDRVAREFKRRLGDSTPILLAGTPYSAEALMSRLLRWVVEEVSTREGGPPDAITVTHPANWGPYKIDLLNQAIRIADVGAPVTLMTEPEAAAVSYAAQQRLDPGQVVAVFDLGGGTFDAAVLRRTADGFEIMGEPEGIERLGGIDFDAAVFAHVTRVVGESLQELDEDDPAAQNAVARLRADCVEAKEALSADTDASIPVMLPNLQTEVRLTRAEFEGMIRPSLVDAIDALRRALRAAGVAAEDIAAVLLVGGSSRIPLVAQLVGAELGRPVAVDAHPKHAIAIGAAYAAGGEVTHSATSPPAVAPVLPVDPPTGASVEPPSAPPDVPSPAEPATAGEIASPAGATAAAIGASGGVPGGESTDALPASPPPPAPPPGAPGDGGGGGRGRWPVIAAAVVAVIAALVGVIALTSGGDDDPVAAGDDDTSATSSTTSTSTTTTSSTTTSSTTTVPADEDCTEAMEQDIWVCLETVRLDGSDLVVSFDGDFQGETLSINDGVHLHVFGNELDPVNAGANGPAPGTWKVIEGVDEFTIALDDAAIGAGSDKLCALVADARPEAVGVAHGYYDPANGNCLPIPA